jgi:hypothetical protein
MDKEDPKPYLRLVTIGLEVYYIDPNGNIYGGPNKIQKPSGGWQFIGIRHVKKNRFLGREDLSEMLLYEARNGIDNLQDRYWWRYKNEKGQWHVIDDDHGTIRMWTSPDSRRVASIQLYDPTGETI